MPLLTVTEPTSWSYPAVALHYEVSGDGPALCLLTGLGFGAWSWYLQIPALSQHFTTIAIDNRGIGESIAPPGPFSIADMANDAAALIRALDCGPAHILGLSLGGFIAQELVLRHPDLVSGLVLACTNAGLGHFIPASTLTLNRMMLEANAGWSDEILRQGGHLRFSDRALTERVPLIAELAERRRGRLPARELWDRQLGAAMSFSAGARLAAVRAPTLIIHGQDDPIVPVRNAELLADLIPNAELALIPEGRHLFFMEFAEQFNRRVIDFLTDVPRN